MSAQIRKKHVGVAVAAAVAATAVAIGATARTSSGEPVASTPEWFAPIAASYGNDPRITPSFDFASLYSPGHPEWFAGIAEYYGNNPLITPDFDFASLYSGDPR